MSVSKRETVPELAAVLSSPLHGGSYLNIYLGLDFHARVLAPGQCHTPSLKSGRSSIRSLW